LLPDALAGRCVTLDSDNADGMRRLLELLAGLGHRAAGFVCQDALTDSERFAAFERWSTELGLTTRADWCLGDVGISLDGARAALTRLRVKDGLPPAIVCSHDDVALSLMDALAEAGLRCPEDVSVVGFGNNSVHGSEALSHLTTVKLDTERQTQETMRLLAKQFTGTRDAPEHVRIPVTLVDRGSASTPRPAGDTPTAIATAGGSEEILLETAER
jgi:LacI family transcriptional regulator